MPSELLEIGEDGYDLSSGIEPRQDRRVPTMTTAFTRLVWIIVP